MNGPGDTTASAPNPKSVATVPVPNVGVAVGDHAYCAMYTPSIAATTGGAVSPANSAVNAAAFNTSVPEPVCKSNPV